MRTKRPSDPSKWFSRDMGAIQERVKAAYGDGNWPLTDGGNVSCSKTALDESGDPLLEAIAHLGELLAVRNKDVKMLKAGVDHPIHTRYGYAATTRTTSSAPNIQNFRRKKGIRECLIPRPGMCFVETDYPSLELFTLAQVCAWKLGRYDLVTNMNQGKDYHAVIAAGILKTTYEDVMARKGTEAHVKNARDCGKYGNYGLCGYMTDPKTFALYVNLGSRTEENPHGLRWTEQQAAEVMALWRKNATDPVAFLKYVDTLKNSIGLYDVEIPGTTIVRRGCTRTAAANTHFQGLGATVARRAGWRIAKRQYITRDMPSRTAVFCHDAFLAECRIEDRDEVAKAQEDEMAAALTEICPDMYIVTDAERWKDATVIDSAAMDHYSKHAKSKRDAEGRLIVCKM
jgi:DNA polymerase I-like protein with 3'-5' exonuclease and polymerase domains